MKMLVKSAWGSDDPTKAAFPFLHANALAETEAPDSPVGRGAGGPDRAMSGVYGTRAWRIRWNSPIMPSGWPSEPVR